MRRGLDLTSRRNIDMNKPLPRKHKTPSRPPGDQPVSSGALESCDINTRRSAIGDPLVGLQLWHAADMRKCHSGFLESSPPPSHELQAAVLAERGEARRPAGRGILPPAGNVSPPRGRTGQLIGRRAAGPGRGMCDTLRVPYHARILIYRETTYIV